tara:strand:- start:39 stop:224 length:186 start_codon:yes stop_codon:yes gene_type:complete
MGDNGILDKFLKSADAYEGFIEDSYIKHLEDENRELRKIVAMAVELSEGIIKKDNDNKGLI